MSLSRVACPGTMVEKEMPRMQVGMVDACFEEGNYKRGIDIMNDLRMQGVRPTESYVRQLIYLSLYPPIAQKQDTDLRASQSSSRTPSSPSKKVGRGDSELNRLAKNAIYPKAENILAAQKLLTGLSSDELSPEAVMRAVPCYPLSEDESADAPRKIPRKLTLDAERLSHIQIDTDSFLAKMTEEVLHAIRDCWDMLRPDVVKQIKANQDTDKDKDKDKDRAKDDDDDEMDSSYCIGSQAWPLLECFVRLFEKDVALAGRPEACSSLLLSQIKQVEGIDGISRPNSDKVIEVMFECFAQPSRQRRKLGSGLLQLLLGLTNARCFGSSQLLTSLTSRLRSAPESVFPTVLSSLPDTKRGRAFRLALCDRYVRASMSRGGAGSRPIPKARAVMRRNQDEAVPAPETKKQEFPWETLSSQRILEVLDQTAQSPPNASILHALYHMVLDFGMLRTTEKADGLPVDESWVNALATGDLHQKISQTFKLSTSGEKTQDAVDRQGMVLVLDAMCEQWKANLK